MKKMYRKPQAVCKPETINDLIPIYKGKGDVKLCGSYRSIKLLEHGVKAVEKMFVKRLRKVVDINEMQMTK